MTGPQSPRRTNQFQTSVLVINTAAFALCFAMWVMFGPSTRVISEELGVSTPLATLIKTVPILIGSIFRIPVGILTDRMGARRVFTALMLIGSGAAFAISLAPTASSIVVASAVLGMVGTSFVVGVQSVSKWTSKDRQGIALGIFGAGNLGTALTTFGMPLLLIAVGWRGTFQVYAAVMLLAAAAYGTLMRDPPQAGVRPTLSVLVAPLNHPVAWLFGLYYMATFGVFVGITLTISDLYIDGYHVSLKTAGILATTFTFTASLCRIPGGWLADRYGPRLVLQASLVIVILSLGLVVHALPLASAVGLMFVAGVALGLGMGSSFRYIPDCFPSTVGAVGGIVGALGGIGGFLLPLAGQAVKTAGGSVFGQVLPLAVLALLATLMQSLAEMPIRNWASSRSAEVV
jgi:NNP family nitrate/nitrite transporter-like MFS transporter